MIRDNKLHQLDAYLQSLGNDGSGAQSLDHAIFKLVKQGTVTLDEAVRMASHPQKLNELIHGLPAEA
jgi:Tfp pilus assembly pilus retraction ATPase PilT